MKKSNAIADHSNSDDSFTQIQMLGSAREKSLRDFFRSTDEGICACRRPPQALAAVFMGVDHV